MKHFYLFLIVFLGLGIAANAQPANDDCTTAQNIGALPNPAACPSGVGNIVNVPGTLVGATEANPYVYQNGCTGAGGPNMGVPANDVWYTFTATGYQCVITINSTFANPNVAFYSGTCGALGGGIGGCAVGTGGTVTLTVEQMVPGTTYYVQVSGNTGQTGTFTMSIRNNRDCADCLIGSSLVVNPPPVNGAYQPGQVVNFCYTVNDWSEINTNWFHGVQITFGSGWAGLSNPVPAATVQAGGGNWIYYPAGVTSTATGLNLGPGFYFNTGGGTAGNNFGDQCGPLAANIPCPAAVSWTFCWDMTVAAGCNPGSNLSVTINTSGDGESGSWNNVGCVDDPATNFNAVGACCPPNMAAVNISCPGSNDGQATATPIGAAGPYDYTWNGPGGYVSNTANVAGANTITGLTTAGVYTVSVTDNNNCLSTATVTVNIGANPVPVPANTGPYCEGAQINLSVGAGFVDWDWVGPNAYVQNNTQNPAIGSSTLAMSGVYTVTVTNAGGCTGTGTTTVTVNALPVPAANNTGPYCQGATINLSSNGGVDYDWVGPNVYVQNNTQNPAIGSSTPAMSGTYTVTVTNAAGCSATATTSVTVNPSPTPAANNTGPYCEGATIQLNSIGGSATDDWAGPNAYNQANVQNPTIGSSTTLMSGVYTVTATSAAGCTATATTTVTVNPVPVPVANNTGPYCVGVNINLTSGPGGMIDYDWVGPNAYNQANTQNPVIAGSTLAMAGVYTVTVTAPGGCTATATTTVVVNNSLPINPNNTGPYCEGATIDLTAPAGGIDYDWVGPNAYVQNNTQNPSIPGSTLAMAGVYTVTATYAGGCTATGTTTVVIGSVPVPVANSNTPICEGANLNLNAVGGVDYDWVGPNAYVQNDTQNPTILAATVASSGTYTVTVSDAAGCSATATTIVVVNPLPPAVAGNTGPVCDGTNVDLTANGGVLYSWAGPGGFVDPVTQNPTIIGATPANSGVYTVTVTDGNNCSATATTSLVVNSLPNVNANTNAPVCEGADINLTSNGATGYNWIGPAGFASAIQNPVILNSTSANAGIYTVTGTDANGCTSTATVVVATYPNPTALFVGNPLNGCAPLCVDLTDQSMVVGSVITSWSWNVEGQNPSVNQNETFCFASPGVYDAALTVTTSDGCSSTLSMANYINVSPNPVASFMFTPQEIVELDPEVIFASTSVGATSWLWDFGDGSFSNIENPVHSYGDTGTYCITLYVSNAAGCTDTTVGCLYVQPEFSLYIPNAFTVNGDNLNEIWKLYGRGIKSIEARIFDRWGEELYYFDDLQKGWPGTRQTGGTVCKQDVYVYRVVVTDPSNDEHTFIGRVTLIR